MSRGHAHLEPHARPLPPPQAKSKAFDLSKIRQYMGADVLSLLSVPVFIMEPTSMLQKMAEMMEYAGLLDAAAAAQNPVER
jgi:hypothetical protein